MNAVEIYEKASWDLEHNEITLGEFEERVKALYDVEPVRHGHWDNMFNGKFTGGAYWYRCSNCGHIVPDVRNGGWNYCPDCGVKMDGWEEPVADDFDCWEKSGAADAYADHQR